MKAPKKGCGLNQQLWRNDFSKLLSNNALQQNTTISETKQFEDFEFTEITKNAKQAKADPKGLE